MVKGGQLDEDPVIVPRIWKSWTNYAYQAIYSKYADIYSKRAEMKRTSREVSTSTKQKIAQGVRKAHAQKTEQEKQQWRAAISKGQKRAWATIPKKEEDEPQLDYATDW